MAATKVGITRCEKGMSQDAVNTALQQRRLSAVLAADVAGYSSLMGADEEGTLQALNSAAQ
jgi:class 3 adenylate cyclase